MKSKRKRQRYPRVGVFMEGDPGVRGIECPELWHPCASGCSPPLKEEGELKLLSGSPLILENRN